MIHQLIVYALVTVCTLAASAAQAGGYLWWNVEITMADRERMAERPTFVVYGPGPSIEVQLFLKNAEGPQRLSTLVADLQNAIRFNVVGGGERIASTVDWKPEGRWSDYGRSLTLHEQSPVELNPGDVIELRAVLTQADSRPWGEGEYVVNVDLSQAVSVMRSDDRTWVPRTRTNGTFVVRVVALDTLGKQKRRLQLAGSNAMMADRVPEAIGHFRALSKLDPTDANSSGLLGSALLRAGEYREAAAALERALPLVRPGEKNSIPDSLAFAYVKLNDTGNALRVLRQRYPEPVAQSELARLRVAAARR